MPLQQTSVRLPSKVLQHISIIAVMLSRLSSIACVKIVMLNVNSIGAGIVGALIAMPASRPVDSRGGSP